MLKRKRFTDKLRSRPGVCHWVLCDSVSELTYLTATECVYASSQPSFLIRFLTAVCGLLTYFIIYIHTLWHQEFNFFSVLLVIAFMSIHVHVHVWVFLKDWYNHNITRVTWSCQRNFYHSCHIKCVCLISVVVNWQILSVCHRNCLIFARVTDMAFCGYHVFVVVVTG